MLNELGLLGSVQPLTSPVFKRIKEDHSIILSYYESMNYLFHNAQGDLQSYNENHLKMA